MITLTPSVLKRQFHEYLYETIITRESEMSYIHSHTLKSLLNMA